jgi:hypothetical protein
VVGTSSCPMSGGDVRRGRTTSFTEAVEMEIVYRRGVGREELAERQPTSKVRCRTQ